MKKRVFATLVSLFALLTLSTAENALSADYWKGLEAYKQGNHAIALQEWLPQAAEQGHTDAQYNLDVLRASREEDAHDHGGEIAPNQVMRITNTPAQARLSA